MTRRLRLIAALRHDRYSDYGSSTTPKLGFRFAPLPRLAVRGTYAEAFRAPGPAENGRSASALYVGYLVLTRGNPDVKPERARSATLGIVAEPVRGASLSVDFWRIVRTGEITGADAAFVVGAGQQTGTPLASVDGGRPARRSSTTRPATSRPSSRLTSTAAAPPRHGVDVEARQRIDLGAHGRLTASLAWTHVAGFAREIGGLTYEYAGTHGPYSLGAAAGTPKDRLTIGLTWDIGDMSATLRANHVSSMQGVDHSSAPYDPLGLELGAVPDGTTIPCGAYFPDGRAAPNADCRIASFTSFDLSGRWKLSRPAHAGRLGHQPVQSARPVGSLHLRLGELQQQLSPGRRGGAFHEGRPALPVLGVTLRRLADRCFPFPASDPCRWTGRPAETDPTDISPASAR